MCSQAHGRHFVLGAATLVGACQGVREAVSPPPKSALQCAAGSLQSVLVRFVVLRPYCCRERWSTKLSGVE